MQATETGVEIMPNNGQVIPPMPGYPPTGNLRGPAVPSSPKSMGERFVARMGADFVFQLILGLALALAMALGTVLILNDAINRMDRSQWVDAAVHLNDAVGAYIGG